MRRSRWKAGFRCFPPRPSGAGNGAGILVLLALASCVPPAPVSPVAKAVDFLLSRQSPDGLWRSETTTLLGSGQALTPFVLYALSHAPPEVLAPRRKSIDRALDNLPLAGDEYPVYSLALSILALERLRPTAETSALVRELRARQRPDGGWDRPDISVTAFAAEALGGDERARRFAESCRASGGGYVFTPDKSWGHLNKAGARGYETATFDALRVLGDTGETAPPLPAEWQEGLFFYAAFVRSKVRPDPATAAAVAARQNADGSFKNPIGLMKEDDPLVATGLALAALCLSARR